MEYVVTNATLITMGKGAFKKQGSVYVKDGVFMDVGEINPKDYPRATVIDAKGRYVTPGFVEAHCHIGIGEAYIGQTGADYNEITDPITPELRAYDAIKPLDPHFDAALRYGVTTVAPGPGSANLIGGTFMVMKTNCDDPYEKRVVKKEVAMKMALGENPKRCYQGKGPQTRMANAARLREALTKAKIYKDAWDKYNGALKKGEKCNKPEYNAKWESLKRVFEGLPVKIHAHQHDDILTAMRIMQEFGLDSTIEHCTEGWMIVDELKTCKQKVCCGPIFIDQMKWEVRNVNRKSPKIFFENDIDFCIITDAPVVPMDGGMTYQLALAVKDGLPERKAFECVTTTPAKFLGVFDRVGSIEKGKDADLVIWSGHPFDSLTFADVVMVNGSIKVDRYKENEEKE